MPTATPVSDTQLSEARSSLITLIAPHRGTEVMMRINSFVFDKTKLKLPEFLASKETDNDAKFEIVTELIEILKSGDYSKLPAAPTGQAQTPNTGAAAAPAKPAAVKPTPTKAAPAPEPTPVALATDGGEEDPDIIELQLKLAQAKAAKEKAAKAAAGLSSDDVRKIINEELEKLLTCTEFRAAIDERIALAVDARVAAIFETIAVSLKEKK